MDEVKNARRRGNVGQPHLFVDVTTSLMLAGESPVGISRVEGEVARRLLCSSQFKTVPVVFRSDGQLLALSSEQVGRIFQAKPTQPLLEDNASLVPSTEGHSERPSAELSEIHQQPMEVLRRPLSVKVRLRATSLLRRFARGTVAALPPSVREDVRSILIHSRQIVRTMLYRSPPADSTPPPPPPPPLRDQIIPELRAVVHPCKGDIFWTAGLYSNFVPLQTLGSVPLQTLREIREKTGLKLSLPFMT